MSKTRHVQGSSSPSVGPTGRTVPSSTRRGVNPLRAGPLSRATERSGEWSETYETSSNRRRNRLGDPLSRGALPRG